MTGLQMPRAQEEATQVTCVTVFDILYICGSRLDTYTKKTGLLINYRESALHARALLRIN